MEQQEFNTEEVAQKWQDLISQVEVEEMNIYDLKPSTLNPRTIVDERYKQLLIDINNDPEFMWQRPILAYKEGKNLIIYAGHQRWKACLELGWETVPVSVDADLDEETMKNRMILDNLYYGDWDKKVFGSFDDSLLKELGLMDAGGLKFDDFLKSKSDTSGMDKKLKNKRKDRSEEEENTEAGKHFFNLIFNTAEEKEEFSDYAKNWAGSERFEDKLIKILKEQYGTD